MVLKIHLALELCNEVVEHVALHVAQAELFLGIFAYERYPLAAGAHIVGMDMLHSLGIEIIDVVVVENHAVGPSPAILVVVLVDGDKACQHVFYRLELAVDDVVHKSLLLAHG